MGELLSLLSLGERCQAEGLTEGAPTGTSCHLPQWGRS
jgi:hypothetical protein